MALIDLPTELLEIIIQSAIPADSFENVILTCKTTFRAGKGLIPQYNTWKRNWTKVTLSNSGQPEKVLDILHAIAKEPIIARFIKTLNLEHAQDYYAEEVDKRDDAPILTLLQESTVLERSGQEPMAWLASMLTTPYQIDTTGGINEKYKQSVAIEIMVLCRTVLLLTLLPNITILTPPAKWNIFTRKYETLQLPPHGCGHVMETLVRQARAPTQEVPNPKPLGKLEHLLPYAKVHFDPQPQASFDAVAPFMALPTLTTLHVTNMSAVSDGYTGMGYEWPYPNLQSNVTSLNLSGCCVDPEGIEKLLEHTPYLTKFQYSHHVKWHGCGYGWSAGAFIATVGKHCGGALKELSVTTLNPINEIETGVFSLREFQVLEYLELSTAVFYGPPPDDLEFPETEAIQALATILPPSIKRIRLNAGAFHGFPGDGFGLLNRLLPQSEKGDRSNWASGLPALESTTVVYHEDSDPRQQRPKNFQRFEAYLCGTGVILEKTMNMGYRVMRSVFPSRSVS